MVENRPNNLHKAGGGVTRSSQEMKNTVLSENGSNWTVLRPSEGESGTGQLFTGRCHLNSVRWHFVRAVSDRHSPRKKRQGTQRKNNSLNQR